MILLTDEEIAEIPIKIDYNDSTPLYSLDDALIWAIKMVSYMERKVAKAQAKKIFRALDCGGITPHCNCGCWQAFKKEVEE